MMQVPSPPASTDNPSRLTPQITDQSRKAPFASALWCLILVAGCVTAADLLLKRGAMDAGGAQSALIPLANFASPYTIAGILIHLAGLAAWMYTLRILPLSLAYCFTAIQQVTIALGAWLWLGERITSMRWAGIALVFAGVLALVPAIIAADAAHHRQGELA